VYKQNFHCNYDHGVGLRTRSHSLPQKEDSNSRPKPGLWLRLHTPDQYGTEVSAMLTTIGINSAKSIFPQFTLQICGLSSPPETVKFP